MIKLGIFHKEKNINGFCLGFYRLGVYTSGRATKLRQNCTRRKIGSHLRFPIHQGKCAIHFE